MLHWHVQWRNAMSACDRADAASFSSASPPPNDISLLAPPSLFAFNFCNLLVRWTTYKVHIHRLQRSHPLPSISHPKLVTPYRPVQFTFASTTTFFVFQYSLLYFRCILDRLTGVVSCSKCVFHRPEKYPFVGFWFSRHRQSVLPRLTRPAWLQFVWRRTASRNLHARLVMFTILFSRF